ncbi:MAG: efflux RND transporter permease subunit, partial [Pseudomonadota bacterium]
MGLVSFFARHGTAANLLLSVLVVAGLFAATGLRTQYLPDVVTEEINVSIRWDGASVAQVDRTIVSAVTPNLLNLDGLDTVRSRARDGRASFTLTFDPGWDMERALADVTAATPSQNELPEGAHAPIVNRDGWRDRVLDVVLSADLDRAQLELLGEQLTAELQRAGVPRPYLRGRTAPAISVTVDPAQLDLYDLELSDVAQAVEAGVFLRGAGRFIGEASRVVLGDDASDANSLRTLPIPTTDGAVALGQVATLTTAQAGSGRAYFLGAVPAVSISVDRGPEGDALAIEDTVERALERFLATAPEGTEVELIRNRAAEIEQRLLLLVDNAALGLLLVLVLLFLFLSPGAALWVAAGIPVALAAGLALMWVTDQTLNMVSIYALILCLGIIVDDAIVVAEHAEHRAARGEPRQKAAERAARRMLGPVLASTLTTIIAFLSLYFVGGRFGEFIATIPFVVAVVLIASLAECFLILPHHMAKGTDRLNRSFLAWPSRNVNRGFEWVRDRAFRPFIGAVIAFRYAVLLLVAAATAHAGLMFLEGDVRWRFFASPQSNTVSANFAMVDGATRDDTQAMLAAVEDAITRVPLQTLTGETPVTFTLGEIGGNAGRGLDIAEDKEIDLLGSVTIELVDADARAFSSRNFARALEEALEAPETLEAFSFRAGRRGPAGDDLDVVLFGTAQPRMAEAAKALSTELAAIPEITSVEDSLVASSVDRRLTLTPFGASQGYELADVATALRERISGITAHEFVQGTEQGAVTVRLPLTAGGPDVFDTLRLTAPNGAVALLGDIVEVTPSPSPRSLRRTDGQLVVRVSGEITADAARAAEIDAELRQRILPTLTATYGVSTRLSGLAEQEEEFINDAVIGYGLCLLGIYAALALVLGSWAKPFTIMLVIPAGLIGVLWGHYLWGLPMNIFSVVGFIGLSGIIVNDSIVLVTAISERLKTRATIPATIDAACERLRPVMLTTLTTVMGLAPLLFETSRQAEILKPMVLTLVSGLSLGFFLVL